MQYIIVHELSLFHGHDLCVVFHIVLLLHSFHKLHNDSFEQSASPHIRQPSSHNLSSNHMLCVFLDYDFFFASLTFFPYTLDHSYEKRDTLFDMLYARE